VPDDEDHKILLKKLSREKLRELKAEETYDLQLSIFAQGQKDPSPTHQPQHTKESDMSKTSNNARQTPTHARDPNGVNLMMYTRYIIQKWWPYQDQVWIGVRAKGGAPSNGEFKRPIHKENLVWLVRSGGHGGPRIRMDGTVANPGERVPTVRTVREAMEIGLLHMGIDPNEHVFPPVHPPYEPTSKRSRLSRSRSKTTKTKTKTTTTKTPTTKAPVNGMREQAQREVTMVLKKRARLEELRAKIQTHEQEYAMEQYKVLGLLEGLELAGISVEDLRNQIPS